MSSAILSTTDASRFITRQAGLTDTKLSGQQQFTIQELELLARLKRRDPEVRAHEQAHRAVAAEAAAMAIQARIEISGEQQQKQEEENNQVKTSNSVNTYLLSSTYRPEKEQIRLLDELI